MLALDSGLSGPSLLRRLNAISPELFFTAATPAPAGFRVRHAARRTYRYFEPRPVDHASAVERAAALFRGRVDVRSFGRGVPARTPQWRDLESVTVNRWGSGHLIEVRAPSFVWGMVRKIVGSLREVDQGRLSTQRLEAAISGAERLTLPMAEPEGLVLWEVEYPLEWETVWTGPNRHQLAFGGNLGSALWTRAQVLSALFEAGDAGGHAGLSRGPVSPSIRPGPPNPGPER